MCPACLTQPDSRSDLVAVVLAVGLRVRRRHYRVLGGFFPDGADGRGRGAAAGPDAAPGGRTYTSLLHWVQSFSS